MEAVVVRLVAVWLVAVRVEPRRIIPVGVRVVGPLALVGATQVELDEVLASQRAMLDRTQASDAQPGDDTLKRAYENQLSEVKSWLARQPNVRAVFVAHCLALRSPERVARSVADFLSATGGFPEDSSQLGSHDSRIEAMARIVDARLHRHHLAAID